MSGGLFWMFALYTSFIAIVALVLFVVALI